MTSPDPDVTAPPMLGLSQQFSCLNALRLGLSVFEVKL